jgi:ABC-type arginine/histidine transport system permease subunit
MLSEAHLIVIGMVTLLIISVIVALVLALVLALVPEDRE